MNYDPFTVPSNIMITATATDRSLYDLLVINGEGLNQIRSKDAINIQPQGEDIRYSCNGNPVSGTTGFILSGGTVSAGRIIGAQTLLIRGEEIKNFHFCRDGSALADVPCAVNIGNA